VIVKRKRWKVRVRRSTRVHASYFSAFDRPLCGVMKRGDEVLSPKSAKQVDCPACLRQAAVYAELN
jgi:hypothetical protein